MASEIILADQGGAGLDRVLGSVPGKEKVPTVRHRNGAVKLTAGQMLPQARCNPGPRADPIAPG